MSTFDCRLEPPPIRGTNSHIRLHESSKRYFFLISTDSRRPLERHLRNWSTCGKRGRNGLQMTPKIWNTHLMGPFRPVLRGFTGGTPRGPRANTSRRRCPRTTARCAKQGPGRSEANGPSSAAAEVDDIKDVDTSLAQVVVNPPSQFGGTLGAVPLSVGAARGPTWSRS